jgi:hypothetical protein
MKKVTIYLKTPLFALKGGEDSVPTGAIVVDGEISEEGKGGVYIDVTSYFSVERKSSSKQVLKNLEGKKTSLFIPTGKIDHIRIHPG